MHVLHRPDHLYRVALATVAAVVAVTLALAIAGGLHIFTSAATAGGVPSSSPAASLLPASSSTNPFTQNPLRTPFTAPVRLPWVPLAH